MKKFVFIILGLALVVYLTGCGKKQAMEETQEPVSIESLSTISAEPKTVTPESKTSVASAPVVAPAQAPAKLEPLPPSGPYKPTTQEIQTALKNANFYAGAIDGKKGPLTTKAIEDFQKANGLKVDGKVGPKTWEVLKTYLNPPVETPAPSKKKQ